MGDDVVQLLRDPQPLLAGSAQFFLLAGPCRRGHAIAVGPEEFGDKAQYNETRADEQYLVHAVVVDAEHHSSADMSEVQPGER
jgi:hypothetical protein